MRKGKGDLEPTRLRGGLPPVQLNDIMLETDSGAGEQDRGLHRAEHGLCEHRMKEIRSKAFCITENTYATHYGKMKATMIVKEKTVSTVGQVRTVTEANASELSQILVFSCVVHDVQKY